MLDLLFRVVGVLVTLALGLFLLSLLGISPRELGVAINEGLGMVGDFLRGIFTG